jgi:hypothetical protein
MKKLVGTVVFSWIACPWLDSAVAGPLPVDGGWYGFCFREISSGASLGCRHEAVGEIENTISFTASAPVVLKVTDAFQYGDRFSLTIDGAGPLLTSIPGFDATMSPIPDDAFDSLPYSKLAVPLAAGAHTLDIFAAESPFGSGGGYVRVDTVPEPATFLLMVAGLLALLRRRSRAPNISCVR